MKTFLRLFSLGVVSFSVLLSAPAHALTFQNNFDSSWDSYGTAKSEAEQAALAAESQLSSLFSNQVTLSINFAAGGSFGDEYFNNDEYASPYGTRNYSYSQVQTILQNAAAAHPENTALADTIANLPGSISCPGCTDPSNPDFMLSDSELMALTGASSSNAYQGFIDINPLISWDANQSDGINASSYDLTAVMLHEITHAMGRDDFAFVNGQDPLLTLLDLNRYDCGSTTLTTSASNACFSLDGGNTDLAQFSATSDTGDLAGNGSADDAYLSSGTVLSLTNNDILMMNSLGWNSVANVPEPNGLALLLVGFGILGMTSRKRLPKK